MRAVPCRFRTARFNWLYARHTGGVFVLRIEDTDKARNTEEATRAIYDGLRWLGLDWDEGPFAGGAYGPYFQSEREEIYLRYFNSLKDAGHLYEDNGAWRFRSQRETVVLDDLVCGRIEFDLSNPETHPDITIRRPDGGWIFHFVNVVDDIEMKITHVIRGEDHLSNTPKHLELYRAFGVEPPRFSHIPLILNRDGSKMSKRDQGAAVDAYLEQGYAPEAVRNYLCLLGWSPKDNREIIPSDEVVALFDLAKINRKSAAYDLDKCAWMNAQDLMRMPFERFVELSVPFVEKAGIAYGSIERLKPVLAIIQEKVKLLSEVPAKIAFFFTEEVAFDPEAVEKTLRKPGALEKLSTLASRYETLEPWTVEALESTLKATAAEMGCKAGELIHPARVAVSGLTVGPSLYHMLEVMGKDRVLARMRAAAHQFA